MRTKPAYLEHCIVFRETYREWLRPISVTTRQTHRAGEKCFVGDSGNKLKHVDSVNRALLASLATLGFAGLLLEAGGGCSSSSTDAAPSADEREAGDATRAPERTDARRDAPSSPALPTMDGWSPWPDYAPWCDVYTATDPSALPPITWEPCLASSEPWAASCQHMRLDWPVPPRLGMHVSPDSQAIVNSDGSVDLVTTREANGDVVRIIVDADGPVRNAVRATAHDCSVVNAHSYGGHFAFQILTSEATGQIDSRSGGAMGGAIGERPQLMFRYQDNDPSHSYVAGPPGIVDVSRYQLRTWADPATAIQIPTSPEDVGLFTNEWFFVGETFHWNTGSLALSRQKFWTASQGTQTFLTAGEDFLHGYGDLASDGVQMVWHEGDRTDYTQVYPRLSIVVSNYTTDPSTAQRRVFRSNITGNGFGTTPWVVGCGYAARSSTLEPTPGNFIVATVIVRLSDGVMWQLPDDPAFPIGWRRPLALTCTEFFGLVQEPGIDGAILSMNIARVRLDSLGPGTPPP